jgi:DNA-binding CsgD family transcriptional regulator
MPKTGKTRKKSKPATAAKPAALPPSKMVAAQASVAPDLPLHQVQAMLRLVGETAELWYDPKLQRQYMLESLCTMLEAAAALCFTFGDRLIGGSGNCGPLIAAGLDDEKEQSISNYLSTGQPADPALRELMNLPSESGYSATSTVAARGRADLIDDAAWKGSDHFRLRESIGLPRVLYARIQVPSKTVVLQLMRAESDPAFTEADRHLLELSLSQMSWPHQADDAPTDPRIEALQPRLRKVMKHLLEGDGEKQVALKLGLSRHTVHEYVKMLYQQLGVSSRSELLSQFVGRV